jgi:hypothetical protein
VIWLGLRQAQLTAIAVLLLVVPPVIYFWWRATERGSTSRSARERLRSSPPT